MYEKEVHDEKRWPGGKATIRMYDMTAMADFTRAYNPVRAAGAQMPMSGHDLLSLFKRALVRWENLPLLDGTTCSGEDLSDPKLKYVDMNFAFKVVVDAAEYSELQEDEAKNS